MNILDKIFIIIVAIILIVVGFFLGKVENDQFGALRTLEGAYFSAGSMATTSIGTATSSTQVLASNPDRLWAAICNDGAGVVGLFEEATTTGRYSTLGYPIASSTAYNHCYIIDRSHPYLGPVSAVADTTTTIRYIEK